VAKILISLKRNTPPERRHRLGCSLGVGCRRALRRRCDEPLVLLDREVELRAGDPQIPWGNLVSHQMLHESALRVPTPRVAELRQERLGLIDSDEVRKARELLGCDAEHLETFRHTPDDALQPDQREPRPGGIELSKCQLGVVDVCGEKTI
jgi:hypothetical protein